MMQGGEPGKARNARMRPSLAKITRSLAILGLVGGLAAPTLEDWVTRRTATEVAGYRSATPGFDFSGFMSMLSGLISTWMDDLRVLQEGVVAAVEKQSGASQQLSQASINHKAASATAEAAQGGADLVSADLPDSCQFAQEKKIMVEAKQDKALHAKAMTAAKVQQGLSVTNVTAIQNDLLRTSFADYCSPESAERGRCAQASPKSLPDADIQASSMLGTQVGDSETLSDDEYVAAQQYVKWSTQPLPPATLPIAAERTEAGARFLLEQRRNIAVMSSAQQSLNAIIASRRTLH